LTTLVIYRQVTQNKNIKELSMNKLAVAALLGLSLGLSGCVISVDGDGEYGHQSDWQDKEQQNRKYISRLQQNTGYEDILNRMGIADFNELHSKGDDTYQVLYYRTQRIDGDGVTTKNECTPLVFKNSALVGWGDSAYDAISD
jgi:SAM-dependent MidA family methyltransferase